MLSDQQNLQTYTEGGIGGYEIKKENNGSSQISDFNCVVTVYYSACIMDGFDSLQGGSANLFSYSGMDSEPDISGFL